MDSLLRQCLTLVALDPMMLMNRKLNDFYDMRNSRVNDLTMHACARHDMQYLYIGRGKPQVFIRISYTMELCNS